MLLKSFITAFEVPILSGLLSEAGRDKIVFAEIVGVCTIRFPKAKS